MPSSRTASSDRAKLLWTLVIVLAAAAVIAGVAMLRSDDQPAAIPDSPRPASSPAPSLTPSPTKERPPVVVTSTIKARFNKKDLSYRGRVVSEEPKCETDRVVFVKKRQPGPDAIVYNTKTDLEGKWSTPALPELRSGAGVPQAQRKVVLRDDGRTVVCKVFPAVN